MDMFQDVMELPHVKKCFEYKNRINVTEDALRSGNPELVDFILTLLWNQDVIDYYNSDPENNDSIAELNDFVGGMFGFMESDYKVNIYDLYGETKNPSIMLFVKNMVDIEPNFQGRYDEIDELLKEALKQNDKSFFIDAMNKFPTLYKYRPDEFLDDNVYKSNKDIVNRLVRGKVAETTIAMKPLNLPPHVLENILQQAYDVEGTFGLYNTMETIEKYRK